MIDANIFVEAEVNVCKSSAEAIKGNVYMGVDKTTCFARVECPENFSTKKGHAICNRTAAAKSMGLDKDCWGSWRKRRSPCELQWKKTEEALNGSITDPWSSRYG